MAESLTLPHTTFAKLSPHPFLVADLESSASTAAPTRSNGRSLQQPRDLQINVGSLSHAHGSAVVRTGDTTVICGVRGEILPVTNIPNFRPVSRLETPDAAEDTEASGRQELRDYDLLVPNIELATGSAPQFLPGVPPTPLAQTLSTRVYSLLHRCELLDPAELRIWYTKPSTKDEGDDVDMEDHDAESSEQEPEIKAYWTLYIDIFFISYDGNPFDAAWAAMLAALRDTKLPQARWDADREMVVCSRLDPKPLTVRGLPIACTAAVLMEKEQHHGGKHWILHDPDRLEDSLCKEAVTVVLDRSDGETRIRSINKSGGVLIGPQQTADLVRLAEKRWDVFRKVFGDK